MKIVKVGLVLVVVLFAGMANAVPVILTKHFGQHINKHFKRNMKKVS